MHLALIPGLPLLAFVLLGLVGYRLPRALVALLGVAPAAVSGVLVVLAGTDTVAVQQPLSQTLYQWLATADLTVPMGLYLDPLSLVMCGVVTFVGTLILLYSTQFMAKEAGYARFLAFMNLFVGSMLILVLADNLVTLYLGWEGVGLCSYLLIGFWYRDRRNALSAFKAFLVTRVGDISLLIGLLLLYSQLHTVQIQPLLAQAGLAWAPGSSLAVAAAALILGGAVGKSAQLPLQTWLPDAMAGPTPVSALIHAATMVTAGVYLIARLHVLFELAPLVQWLVAACSALTQRDLKRVLAYSTMSQIGYMFLALGVGAWSAAIFHLFTHAFFKSLLFLGAGVVIQSLDEEHDMWKMGGLRRDLPLAFWSLLIGAASLSALPWITAGFFSKDAILSATFASGGWGLWLAGVAGAALTSLYAFRMVFLTFLGQQQLEPRGGRPWQMALPLVMLAALAVIAGYAMAPVTSLLQRTFGVVASVEPYGATGLSRAAMLASIVGIPVAWVLYVRRPQWAVAASGNALVRAIHQFWFLGWGFDWLYGHLFVRPYVFLAQHNRADCLDLLYSGIAALTVGLHRALRLTQTGRVRGYAAALGLGAIIILFAFLAVRP